MVLALSLPLDMPHRPLLMTMIFAVVIFTLLAQGLSIKTFLRTLGLIGGESRQAYEIKKGEIYSLGRVREELEQLAGRGVLSRSNYQLLSQRLKDRLQRLHDDLEQVALEEEDAVHEELRLAEQRLFHAEKDGVKDAYLAGLVSERIMKLLIRRIDEKLFALAEVETGHAAGAADKNQPE